VNWWERPLRIADFGMTEFSLERLESAVRRKKDLAFDVEHLGIVDWNGGDHGVFYFKSSVADRVPDDLLGPYLDRAHRAGIRVLVYLNVHWLQPEFAARHHEWLQLRRDGTAIDNVYGKGMSPCVNSPGYRSYSFQAVRDLARYPIDGIFLDGPIFISNGCFCGACRDKFRAGTGLALPLEDDWDDVAWKRFIEFRYDSITDYLRDSRAALKETRPGAILYMNGQGLWPGWPNGRDNRRLAAHQDLVGAEGGFLGGVLAQVPLWKPAKSAKLLETQAAGKPTVIFSAGKHCSHDRTTLTPAETALLYAGTVAHGASPWYGLYFDDTDTAGPRSTGELNRFIRANERYLGGTTSVANVALMWSVRTADYYRATVPVTDFTQDGDRLTRQVKAGDHYKAFCGYFEALTRGHVPFDVLDEQGVEEKLDGYACLVLPNAACLSDRLAAAIAAWVRKGGLLVSTFETSGYDEWGAKRAAPALAAVLGIRPASIDGPCAIDYFDRGDGELFAGIDQRYIPSPSFRLLCASTTGTSLALYRERMPARYQPLPRLSTHPSIVENRVGEGRSIWFAGTIEEACQEFHFVEHELLMTAPVRRWVEPLVLTDAPSTVEVSLRRQVKRRRLMVHLVNYTGEMVRPLRKILPVRDVKLTLPWVTGVTSAKLLSTGAPIRYSVKGGFSTTIRELGIHEVIVLEGVRQERLSSGPRSTTPRSKQPPLR
jgi:hypothetical protein